MRRVLGVVVVVLAVSIALGGRAEADLEAVDWYDGADGYVQALTEAKDSGRPVFLYFYTDWCGYCRQLERSLLSDATVQDELEGMLSVRVNPEEDAASQQLAARYRVRGFPALFVHPEEGWQSYAPVRRTVAANGRPRLKTPEEFVATLSAARR